MRKIAPLIALFTALSVSAQEYSPKHAIAYACAYCDLTNKKINRWAARQPEQYQSEFRFQMIRLRSFGEWLDQIKDEADAEFSKCWTVAGIRPEGVRVEDAPFTVPGYPSDQRFSGTTDRSGRIRVVYWNVASFGGTQNAIDLFRWEYRNFLWLKTGHRDELGARKPCP